jgi:light-harvesting complex 1 beta chain
MADKDAGTLSGLSAREAQEFHGAFMSGFIGFTVIAVVAHVLAWMWRPWLPGPKGYAELTDGVTRLAGTFTQFLT